MQYGGLQLHFNRNASGQTANVWTIHSAQTRLGLRSLANIIFSEISRPDEPTNGGVAGVANQPCPITNTIPVHVSQ